MPTTASARMAARRMPSDCAAITRLMSALLLALSAAFAASAAASSVFFASRALSASAAPSA